MRYKDFRPARGVTLANSFRHIAAIEDAVVRDIRKVDPSERRFVLRVLRAALKMLLRTIDTLEKQSPPQPMSDEEQTRIYEMMGIEGAKESWIMEI